MHMVELARVDAGNVAGVYEALERDGGVIVADYLQADVLEAVQMLAEAVRTRLAPDTLRLLGIREEGFTAQV